MIDPSVSYFATTNFHNVFMPFGIKQADRLMHVYAIGKTGVGKSTLIETFALRDMQAGRGFALIDPHGDLAERVRDAASPAQRERLIYLDAADPKQPFGYNPLRRVRDDKIPLAAAGLLEAMRKIWLRGDLARMERRSLAGSSSRRLAWLR